MNIIITSGTIVSLCIGFIWMLRRFMQGGKFRKNIRADGKVIIVTGCNTGIGKETVRELAKRGAIIYMACRDLTKAEEACNEIVQETNNKNVFCRQLDLACMHSIRQFVERFKEEQQRLDILINNAGVMRCPKMLTENGFEMQLGVNHLGHFLLTNLLLDLLKKSSPSRIVVVSSLLYKYGKINKADLNSEQSYDRGMAYNQSKLANVLFTRELAERLEGTNVTVNVLHPGVVDTELFRHMRIKCLNSIIRPFEWIFLKTAVNGAQTTLYAALDDELNDVSGQYLSDCKIVKMHPVGKDKEMAKWLWTISENWTKLNT